MEITFADLISFRQDITSLSRCHNVYAKKRNRSLYFYVLLKNETDFFVYGKHGAARASFVVALFERESLCLAHYLSSVLTCVLMSSVW